MIRLEQIDHVALRCASPEATKAWYVSTLGFESVDLGQGSGAGSPIFLRLGSTYITVFPQKEQEQAPTNGRIWHFAFRTATYADFQSAQAELQAKNISFQFRDHQFAHSIYFHDPDGVLLEITSYGVPKDKKAGSAA